MLLTGVATVAAYVLGSVPTGLWLGLWLRGIDIREHGSKNIGATNTMRVLGKRLGALALMGDAGKGVVSVLALAHLSGWPYAPLACGIAAIVGHTFSVFLRLKGGKGVATAAGVFLALCPAPAIMAVAAFLVVLAATRMVSAGSMCAAAVFAGAVLLLPCEWATYPAAPLPEPFTFRIVAVAVAALIVIKHRGNIRRILQGKESRI